MKRIFFTIFILLWCGSAWGATYYIDPDGSDIAAGTSAETAWKQPARAMINVSAGDTIYLSGTSASNPVRNTLSSPANMTLTASDTGYITSSRNLSDGETYIHTVIDLFEAWDDANDLTSWAETGTITREAVAISNGTYSAALTGNANTYIRRSYANVPIEDTRIGFIYKCNAGGGIRWVIKVNGLYLKADGDWTEVVTKVAGYNSTEWAVAYTAWGTATATNNLLLDFALENTTGCYLDGQWVEIKNGWEVVSDDLYSLNYFSNNDNEDVNVLLSCTDAEWTATGVEALEVLQEATITTGLDDIGAGEWYYDRAGTYGDANVLYYNLAAGETDITDIHFETPTINNSVEVNNDLTISNLYAWGGRAGFEISAGTSTINDSTSNLNAIYSYHSDNAAVVTITDSTAKNSTGYDLGVIHGEGFFSAGTSTLTCNRCYATGSADDGYQGYEGSTMNIYWSLGIGNGGCEVEPQHTAGATTIYNSTFIKTDNGNQVVLMDLSDGDSSNTYKNNIFYVIESESGSRNVMSVTKEDPPTIDSDYNSYFVEGAGTMNIIEPFASDVHSVSENPEINTSTGAVTNSSPYLNSGVFINDFNNVYDADYDETQVLHYRIPIGAQGYEPPAGLSKWGVWGGKISP